MNKEKMIEEMKKRGYDISDENHITIFKKEGYIEDLIPEIKEALEEIEYSGSWGVRAATKNANKKAIWHDTERNTVGTGVSSDIRITPAAPKVSNIESENAEDNAKSTTMTEEIKKDLSTRIDTEQITEPVRVTGKQIKKEEKKTPDGFRQLSFEDMFS